MKKTLNTYIDHTMLKQNATKQNIIDLCSEAKKYKFFSVCVNPSFIPLCKKQLKDSKVKICTVIGFPLGQMTTASKVFETKDAIKLGANEIDMVLNISELQAGNLKAVVKEIKAIKAACKKITLKVIIETCLLSDKQIIDACKAVSLAKADFIKTSTGFSTAGATKAHVALMKKHVASKVKIKAAGGISNQKDAYDMIQAGANRLGTSRGVMLVTDSTNCKSGY